jgi:hypothetical protein
MLLLLINTVSASYEKPAKPNDLSTNIINAADNLLDKTYNNKDKFSSLSDYNNYLEKVSKNLIVLRNSFKSDSLKYILVSYLNS